MPRPQGDGGRRESASILLPAQVDPQVDQVGDTTEATNSVNPRREQPHGCVERRQRGRIATRCSGSREIWATIPAAKLVFTNPMKLEYRDT